MPYAILLSLVLLAAQTHAACNDPSPAFVPPKFPTYRDSPILKDAFESITASLDKFISAPEYDTHSFSIEVTSSTDSLWELHHTARDKDPLRPGAEKVDGGSVYRIASITKAFTVLAIIQQHVAGNLSIDDTIDRYLDLRGDIQWSDITLRTLASQLSGIPRDFAMADLIYMVPDPVSLGLPPATGKGVPRCDSPCSGDDLLENLATKQPIWPPKQKSTYSNVNFDLLGLVIENVTGTGYAQYVERTILRPLGMERSSFTKPNDTIAVLPRGENYWDVEQGVQRPTGGLYSTTSDMSKFLRHVLAIYNTLSPQLNWFSPGSYATSLSSYYGMPWEIFRTSSLLRSTSRPVTFVTKGGGLPGYSTYIIMVPDYDLGITIFTAGPPDILDPIREAVTVPLLRAAEETAQGELKDRYTGSFAALAPLNSTIILAQSDSKSLFVESFISNSTVVFSAWELFLLPLTQGRPFRLQLVPSLTYREDEAGRKGEVWRGTVVLEEGKEGVWDDHCLTDIDTLSYDGKPLLEIVFWEGEEGRMEELEMAGFKVRMRRVGGEGVDRELVSVANDGFKNIKEQKIIR